MTQEVFGLVFFYRRDLLDKVPDNKLKTLCHQMAENAWQMEMTSAELNELIALCFNVSRFLSQ